jgi:hypothetical protein
MKHVLRVKATYNPHYLTFIFFLFHLNESHIQKDNISKNPYAQPYNLGCIFSELI